MDEWENLEFDLDEEEINENLTVLDTLSNVENMVIDFSSSIFVFAYESLLSTIVFFVVLGGKKIFCNIRDFCFFFLIYYSDF